MDDTQRKDLERAAAFLSPKTDADCAMDSVEASRLACVLRSLAAANQAPLPEGWKLVPVTPTQEMLAAATGYSAQVDIPHGKGYYKAMLSAAPLLVQPEGGE